MPRDTANERVNSDRVDVASRMHITFKRVTKRAAPQEGEGVGRVLEFVNESFNLVHNRRDIAEMFQAKPLVYVDVKYEKVEAFI